MLTAALQALVAPARALGIPSLPMRLLDVVVPDRVAGRHAWADQGRAAIEARGVNRPDSGRYIEQLEVALEHQPGVEWARVNAPLGRVIVAFADNPPPLDELVAVVEAIEAASLDASVPASTESERDSPLDRVPVERMLIALAADAVGIAVTTATRLTALTPLPVELAAAVSAFDTFPRLRRLVGHVLGRRAADTTLAVASAAAQGVTRGIVGLSLDAIYREMALREATANSASWHRRQGGYFATASTAGAMPVVVERPAALAPGPIERWGDSAATIALTAFAVGLPSTGSPRRAAAVAFAALPKSARMGREGFATQFGQILARRGAVILDPGALRRLDRITTVVLDADVLVTGQQLLGSVVPLPGADPAEIIARLHANFRGDDATRVAIDGPWRLGPIDELPLTGRRGVRERRRLEASGPTVVLGLSHNDQLMGLAAVVPEPSESLEALAAACHRAGRRLVVAGAATAVGTSLADAVLPGGDRLLGTVRALQADGGGLVLLSRRRTALANADIGIGLDDPDGRPPWEAHILIGTDLALAAMLIDGCGVAAAASTRSVRLAQAATALGGVAATASETAVAAPRSLLAVNIAAAAALAQGAWSAMELGRRPLTPPISRVPWHAMPAPVVMRRLGVTENGLSANEVRRRQRRSASPPLAATTLLGSVVDELANPLTPILAAGAALSAAVGSVVDAALVAGVSLASALLGGVQRRGTDRALAALLAHSAVTARVRRDGAETTVPAEELVPGDIVLIATDDVVPADCRVLESANLEVDESSLTGESFPVAKSPEPVIASAVTDRTSMLYEGTTISAGRGVVVVVATGTATEAGRSMAATRVGAAAGGVEARLAQITKVTVPTTLGSATAVVAAGLARGRSLAETAGAGVSLAVAAVPEGLPFLVSAAQLAAARRLSALGALVRNPRTIEALGRVDVLCFDKTGTLTEGRITLTGVAGVDGALTPLAALSESDAAHPRGGLRATPDRGAAGSCAHVTDRAVAAGAERRGRHPHHGSGGLAPARGAAVRAVPRLPRRPRRKRSTPPCSA